MGRGRLTFIGLGADGSIPSIPASTSPGGSLDVTRLGRWSAVRESVGDTTP